MSVTFTGNVDEVIDDLLDNVKRPSRVNLDIISDSMRLAVYENFATESGEGKSWKPLAQQTVEEREFLGFPGTNPILFRTGDLFESATNPNDPDHIEEFSVTGDGFSLAIGTTDPRAGRLNAMRPFLTMDDTQEERLAESIEDFFEAQLNG